MDSAILLSPVALSKLIFDDLLVIEKPLYSFINEFNDVNLENTQPTNGQGDFHFFGSS
jgi:hypothetical protein